MPGVRYEVQQSTNLQTWITAPGYPAAANGPAQQMPFQTTGNAGFFKVNQLDEQPPAIASQYPQDGGFAVPRFANVSRKLAMLSALFAGSNLGRRTSKPRMIFLIRCFNCSSKNCDCQIFSVKPIIMFLPGSCPKKKLTRKLSPSWMAL
jgi:hypothetical protein